MPATAPSWSGCLPAAPAEREPGMELVEVDPEVAARMFARDLGATWASGRPDELGWALSQPNALTAVVELPGRRADGTVDPYFVRLGADHYGPHPPKVNLVVPESLDLAVAGSPWWPRLEGLPTWFGLHNSYPFPDGIHRQLVCFSFSADYYTTNHNPKPTEAWQQGRHTVAASLYRLHEILGPAYYRGPEVERAEAA